MSIYIIFFIIIINININTNIITILLIYCVGPTKIVFYFTKRGDKSNIPHIRPTVSF